MTASRTDDDAATGWARLPVALRLIAVLLATMWAVELVDSLVLGDRLQRQGIQPREIDGLDGVLWAPFLHSGWWHLVSNTFPFAVLGGLVAVRGTTYWVRTTVVIAVVGGLATWALAGSGNHIGASGIVFGFFGALIGAAIFERRLAVGATALVAIMLYGGLIGGLAPQPGISWEGHLFGAAAGLLAARVQARPRERRILPEPPLDDPYWEV